MDDGRVPSSSEQQVEKESVNSTLNNEQSVAEVKKSEITQTNNKPFKEVIKSIESQQKIVTVEEGRKKEPVEDLLREKITGTVKDKISKFEVIKETQTKETIKEKEKILESGKGVKKFEFIQGNSPQREVIKENILEVMKDSVGNKETIKESNPEVIKEKTMEFIKDKSPQLEVIKENSNEITKESINCKETIKEKEEIKESGRGKKLKSPKIGAIKEFIKEKSPSFEVIKEKISPKEVIKENSGEIPKEKISLEVIKEVTIEEESTDELGVNGEKVSKMKGGSIPEIVSKLPVRLSKSAEISPGTKKKRMKSDDKQLIFNRNSKTSSDTVQSPDRLMEKNSLTTEKSKSDSKIQSPSITKDDLSIQLRAPKKKRKKEFRFTFQFGTDKKDLKENYPSSPNEPKSPQEKRPPQSPQAPLTMPPQETINHLNHLKQAVSETRGELEEVRMQSDYFGDYKTKSWMDLVQMHINLRSKISGLEEELREIRKIEKQRRKKSHSHE